ncbi:hypothetical protein GQ44DRAFT_776335 [Phaeosphaeriaceae sp. PMI808]|nr:hypothetical protein GQ44DRAFT_776335 [Phaeosphaeriaceae sp. PMI808]
MACSRLHWLFRRIIDGHSTHHFFPPPPAPIGPNAPQPPPTGSWPKRQSELLFGDIQAPLAGLCDFQDLLCLQNPWMYGDNSTILDLDDGGEPDKRTRRPMSYV